MFHYTNETKKLSLHQLSVSYWSFGYLTFAAFDDYRGNNLSITTTKAALRRVLIAFFPTTASAEAFVALARRNRNGQQGGGGLSTSQKVHSPPPPSGSSSAKWKEHYALVSSKWGAIASGAFSNTSFVML